MSWFGRNDGVAAVAAGFTTIETIDVPGGASRLWYEIYTSDVSVSLDGFNVAYKASKHSDATFVTVVNSVTSDYVNAITNPLLGASADPTTLISDVRCLLWLDIRGINQVRFQASGDATTRIFSFWQMS